MNRLVMHHDYRRGIAADLSLNFNTGQLIDVSATPDGLEFAEGDSEVRVAPSDTLEKMRAFRARIVFRLDPGAQQRRHNLMESQLSFALFVTETGALQGTILDASQNWDGPCSIDGVVDAGSWHVAEYIHDGTSYAQLSLDGQLLTERFDVTGPVPRLGGHGIAIGHWPEPEPIYTFEGILQEAWLWSYDPADDFNSVIDWCCVDLEGLDRLEADLRDSKSTTEDLGQATERVLDYDTEVVNAIVGGDPDVYRALSALAHQLRSAYLAKDRQLFVTTMSQAWRLYQERVGQDQIDEFHRRGRAVLEDVPEQLRDRERLSEIFCWEKLAPRRRERAPVPEREREGEAEGGPGGERQGKRELGDRESDGGEAA